MKTRFRLDFVCLAAVVFFACEAQTLPVSRRFPPRVRQVLSWLPSDTETVFAATAPFAMPAFERPIGDKPERRRSVIETLQLLPLSLFALKEGLLQNHLRGERIELAIEGSRYFRPPHGLGEMPYEGCQIAVLGNVSAGRSTSLFTQLASAALRKEDVAGKKALVFQDKLEDDVWTTFVAFPKADLVLACTNRDYLAEVLQRIGGKAGARALPDDLPEWTSLDASAPFWALRHYDKSQAGRDPTSPLGVDNVNEMADKQATGISLSVNPGKETMAKIFYFSKMQDLLAFLEKRTPLSMKLPGMIEPSARLPIRFRQLAPGIAEIEYALGDAIPVDLFMLVVMGAFGHAVYL